MRNAYQKTWFLTWTMVGPTTYTVSSRLCDYEALRTPTKETSEIPRSVPWTHTPDFHYPKMHMRVGCDEVTISICKRYIDVCVMKSAILTSFRFYYYADAPYGQHAKLNQPRICEYFKQLWKTTSMCTILNFIFICASPTELIRADYEMGRSHFGRFGTKHPFTFAFIHNILVGSKAHRPMQSQEYKKYRTKTMNHQWLTQKPITTHQQFLSTNNSKQIL